MAPPVGQAPDSGVVDATRATLPPVADMVMVPVASGSGRKSVPQRRPLLDQVVPAGGTEPFNGVTCQVVPADDAYWTDQPATDTSARRSG